MIGTHLKAKPTLGLPAIVCASTAAALLLMSLFYINDGIAWHLVLAAVWPICLAVSFWRNREKLFLAELAEDGILTNVPDHEHVPYSTIMAVQAEEPHQRYYPLHVHYSRGKLSIPARVGVPSIELQRFLTQWIPQNKFQAVTGELQAICQKQIDKFGADKVFVYTPRLDAIKGFRGRGGWAFSIATVFTGLFWIIGGPVASINQRHFDGANWAVAGVIFALLGTVLGLFYSSRRWLSGGLPKWKNSGVVISPIGLAIIQDKLRGEMKWNELKRLVFPVKRTSLDTSNSTRIGSIRLDFGGGSVDIFDIYCHPLDVVHERIKGYWQG
ncbi:MAG: hypothetical protein QM703_23820 [Gemmatales bacterium]